MITTNVAYQAGRVINFRTLLFQVHLCWFTWRSGRLGSERSNKVFSAPCDFPGNLGDKPRLVTKATQISTLSGNHCLFVKRLSIRLKLPWLSYM